MEQNPGLDSPHYRAQALVICTHKSIEPKRWRQHSQEFKHLWPHSKFKNSLGYVRPCLKRQTATEKVTMCVQTLMLMRHYTSCCGFQDTLGDVSVGIRYLGGLVWLPVSPVQGMWPCVL